MARLVAILALTSAFAHGNLAWGQLTLLRSFSTEATIDRGPDGIAYHPDEDELFAVDSSNATIYRLTTDGELLDSWANPELAFYEGIGTLPDGNLVVADGGMGTLTVFTPDLLMVQAPLDLTQVSAAPNGIVMVEETDTLFITDDNVLQIMEIDINGQLLGHLTTPEIDPSFLETLGPADLRSGIGEIIKVHVIDGPSSFAALAADFPRLMDDPELLLEYIRSSLLIKKRFIEEDEFDRGPRNVMNYGHSFGHAIESATAFEIPHGIAVTIGMDMANHVAHARGDLHRGYRDAVHQVCEANYRGFLGVPIPEEALFDALSRDKKNVGSSANLILPTGPNASMAKVGVVIDDEFWEQCRSFLVGLGR